MVWHVHKKNGKYNIWSTVTDRYLYSKWKTKQQIIDIYIEKMMEDAVKIAETNIKTADEFGCSASPQFRCDLVEAKNLE